MDNSHIHSSLGDTEPLRTAAISMDSGGTSMGMPCQIPSSPTAPVPRGGEEPHEAPQRSFVLRAVTGEPLWFQTRFLWNKSPGLMAL